MTCSRDPRKGKLTNFHSLVDLLGHAGCLEHPDTVTILSRALEFGADFAVDDHRPPGRLLAWRTSSSANASLCPFECSIESHFGS